MLQRKAFAQFKNWHEAPTPKALLVKGARQVGKSFLAEAFARSVSENVVVFDLLRDSSLKDSFSAAKDPADLFLRMTVASNIPMSSPDCIVIIDEVQECPNVVTLIKYLVQENKCRYILTGSLLGVRPESIDSLPVGYVTQVEMFPLDFEEFCWASGLPADAFEMARACLYKEEPLPDFLYEKMSGLWHRYLMIGGLPDAVNAFLMTNDIDEVRVVHDNLHSMYREDIAKRAPSELRLIIRDIYDLIPSEVTARSRRFKLSDIKDVKRFDQVQQHFLWLTNAGIALSVYNVTAPVSPLLVNEQRNLFKLFYLDAGMLMSRFPKSAYMGILDGNPSMNMGAVYEAAVAQQLAASGWALRYFSSKKVGELDFVLEGNDGIVTVLEVKSGKSYRSHAALSNALETDGYTIDRAIVLAEANVTREEDILYVPVFMAGCL